MSKDVTVVQKFHDCFDAQKLTKSSAIALVQEVVMCFSLSVEDCFPEYVKEQKQLNAKCKVQLLSVSEQLASIMNMIGSDTAGANCEMASNVVEAPVAEQVGKTDNPVQRKGFSKNGVRLGRPPKKTPIDVASKQNDESKPVEPIRRKGFSKNGVRLGRPPKESSRAVIVPSVPKSKEVAVPATKSQEVETKKSFTEEVEELKYGREYSLDALYMYKGQFVRSNRVMQEATPLGIFIPHVRRCGCREFLLYYADGSVGVTLEQAENYAESLPKYLNQSWKVKEAWYDGAIQLVAEEANILLKKMGGDKFEGKYFSALGNYYAKQQILKLKYRYVCDVI